MAKFDSKSFNPLAFGKYISNVPNTKKTELAKSKAVGFNEDARMALSSQTGSLYCRVPYYGRISGSTSQNNDGSTNIASSKLSTFEQGFVVASRMDSWTEKSFSKNITAGVDFMDAVGNQIADYKYEVKEGILLSMLKGVFSMSTVGNTLAARSASEFLTKHTYDITNGVGDANKVGVSTLNSAIQKACGDNKSVFKLAFMHSVVATNLENLQILNYLKYTDEYGVQRDMTIGSWNGRIVLITDQMPTGQLGTTAGVYKMQITTKAAAGDVIKIGNVELTAGTDFSLSTDTATGNAAAIATALNASTDESVSCYTWSSSSSYLVATTDSGFYDVGAFTATVTQDDSGTMVVGTVAEDTAPVFDTTYTTYALGEGSLVLDDIGDANPYEMDRDPRANGGEDTLYVRDRYICGIEGISFEKPVSLVASASNSDLANGSNWEVVNDGTNAIDTKAIPICKIVSLG